MELTFFDDKYTGERCSVCGRKRQVGIIITSHAGSEKGVSSQLISACPNYEACGFMSELKK